MFKKDDIVEAVHDITVGQHLTEVLCEKGTKLRVTGDGGNGLHPIVVAKVNDEFFVFAVSKDEIQKA